MATAQTTCPICSTVCWWEGEADGSQRLTPVPPSDRLTAAAPDLLDACRDLLNELDLRRPDRTHTAETMDAAIKRGDAAIAKATHRE